LAIPSKATLRREEEGAAFKILKYMAKTSFVISVKFAIFDFLLSSAFVSRSS